MKKFSVLIDLKTFCTHRGQLPVRDGFCVGAPADEEVCRPERRRAGTLV